MTDKQRVVIIPGDQPEKGINGYGEKEFNKSKSFKTRVENARERSTSGPGSERDDGEELGDDDGSN